MAALEPQPSVAVAIIGLVPNTNPPLLFSVDVMIMLRVELFAPVEPDPEPEPLMPSLPRSSILLDVSIDIFVVLEPPEKNELKTASGWTPLCCDRLFDCFEAELESRLASWFCRH